MIFYVASAYRRIANHNDIIPNKQFTSFENARSYMYSISHDSDDKVFSNVNGEWIIFWARNKKGEFLVSGEKEGWRDAISLKEYLAKQNNN